MDQPSPAARSHPAIPAPVKPAAGYLEWNDALAAHFFKPEMAGQPVYLYVNRDVIADAGERLDSDLGGLVSAACLGPAWVTRAGLCQRALQTHEAWRSRGLPYPPYLGYLALFVLAAGLEGDFAAHAYYPRLRALLEEPGSGMLPSFDRMLELWDDLERWSVHDRGGELGVFEARIAGGWIHVGLPIAQTVLTADERQALPRIFAAAGLDSTWHPSSAELIRALRLHGPGSLRNRTMALVASQKDPDALSALLDVVADQLAVWDGELEEDAAADGGGRRVQASLRLCLALDAVAGRAHASLRARMNHAFPEDRLILGPLRETPAFSCEESHPGWSLPLVDLDTGRPVEPSPASWISGLRLRDEGLGWELVMRASPVRLFIEGTGEGLPGLLEVYELPRGRQFYLAFQSVHWPALQRWTETGCRGWREIPATTGLPPGWKLGVAEEALSDHQVRDRFPSLAFADLMRLRLLRGIRSALGQTFFAFAPPAIAVEGGTGDEEVWVDDSRLEGSGDGIYELPRNLPLETRIGVEVRRGEHVLKRAAIYLTASFSWCMARPVRLADACGHPVDEIRDGSVAVSGALAFPPDLTARFRADPLHAAGLRGVRGRVFLIGRRPGEISKWPAQPLPEGWDPVWAVPMARRGRAVYCGGSLEEAEPVQDPSTGGDRDLWKQVLWRWRRRIAPPRDALLASLWRGYRQVARHG